MNNDYMDNYDDERGELENLRRKRLRKELLETIHLVCVAAILAMAAYLAILWWAVLR